MPTAPRFEALFIELCGLNVEDAQLPLPVLINLHRARLRAPLRGMAAYVVGDLDVRARQGRLALQQRLKTEYGLEGNLLETLAVQDRYAPLNAMDVWTTGKAGSLLTAVEEMLVNLAEQQWMSYDPLVWLCFLAHRELPMVDILELIEAELVVQPDTHRLVLDMAALAEALRPAGA